MHRADDNRRESAQGKEMKSTLRSVQEKENARRDQAERERERERRERK